MKGIYQHTHPLSKLFFVALAALGCLLVSVIIAALTAMPLFGPNVLETMMGAGVSFDESNIPLLKYLQLWQSIGLFIIPALLLAFVFSTSVWNYLKMNKRISMGSTVLAGFIVLLSGPLISYVGILNAEMDLPQWLSGLEQWMRQSEDQAGTLTKMFVKADSIGILLYNVFLIALIPAIGEEFLFRGVVQRIFLDWTKNKHIAIWISAILFSALHLQFYGFIPRALLGAIFGYLFVWSGSIWLPVIAHFVNNTLAVVAYYLYGVGTLKTDPEKLGADMQNAWIAALLSLIAVVSLMAYFYRIERRKVGNERSKVELGL
ncbi:MAG: CPBP family intramembrane metalloprotease [Prolixibacteraceae bacterium]|nr:CPBP family intramembrane metalloprotease [Prolixibacteraceae bacterium]MBN2650729.1 CPBP family intramembrane metalloprotease [Prolixibacteraceae bacterium]